MWFIFALVASWFYCFSVEINKHYPYDGLLVTTWRCFFASIGFLALLPFMYWPVDPIYYGVIAINTVTATWARQRMFAIVVKNNSRVACLQQPICIVLTFIIWLFLDKAELDRMLTDYPYGAGVMAAIVLVILSLQFIRRNDASWQALKAVFPIGVLYAFLGVFAKLVLDTGEPSLGVSLNWVFLNNLAMFAFSLPFTLRRAKKQGFALRPQHIEKATIYGALTHSTSWVLSAMAVIYTANPAYPAILGAMIPVWFAVYYKARGIRDDFSPVSGLILALAAILLLVVTV